MSEPVAIARAGFTRLDLADYYRACGYRTGAEIGVRQGAFSLALCRAIPGLELLCVDAWQYYLASPPQASQARQDQNLTIARERLLPYGVQIVRAFSMEAVRLVAFESLDFVYIDGNHAYEHVRDDIREWTLRVRTGGTISGDDYDAPGVNRAVMEYLRTSGVNTCHLTEER